MTIKAILESKEISRAKASAMTSKDRRDKKIEEFEEHNRQLQALRRSLYNKAKERGDNIAKGRHPILNSLALPFIGNKIRETNKQTENTQRFIDDLERKQH